MDILPILIAGPDRDRSRDLAARLARAIGRRQIEAGPGPDADPRWVAAESDVPDVGPAEVVEAAADEPVETLRDRLHRTERVDVGGGRSYPVIVGPAAHKLKHIGAAAARQRVTACAARDTVITATTREPVVPAASSECVVARLTA